ALSRARPRIPWGQGEGTGHGVGFPALARITPMVPASSPRKNHVGNNAPLRASAPSRQPPQENSGLPLFPRLHPQARWVGTTDPRGWPRILRAIILSILFILSPSIGPVRMSRGLS